MLRAHPPKARHTDALPAMAIPMVMSGFLAEWILSSLPTEMDCGPLKARSAVFTMYPQHLTHSVAP